MTRCHGADFYCLSGVVTSVGMRQFRKMYNVTAMTVSPTATRSSALYWSQGKEKITGDRKWWVIIDYP